MAQLPVALEQVVDQSILRLRMGLDALDWTYGHSVGSNGRRTWGLPGGGVSLWAGSAGCGKSRLAVAVAARMSLQRYRILYCENEVSLSQLKGWFAGQRHDAQRLFAMQSPDSEDHVRGMRRLRPSLVIIDSVSMVTGLERPSRARLVVEAYRRAADDIGCHVVLIGHLNARSQVKGGTTLPHLVDTTARMVRGELPGWVKFEIADKHRSGPTGRGVMLIHEEHGVKVLFAGDEQFPMMRVRLDPMTGEAIRRVPIPGSGGCHEDIDEHGLPLNLDRPRFGSFFSRKGKRNGRETR